MKKYKMRIKDDEAEYNWYGFDGRHTTNVGFIWLCDSTDYDYDHGLSKSCAKNFTMEEIEKMPYGFVNQYDIIEVKEQLYTVDLGGNSGLVKSIDGSLCLCISYNCFDMKDKALTQSEIEKSKHSVLMAIAEKVDEGE
ncbi:hypothetical protein [Vagococcus fessus]|uniref:Uncharacterized protein n=1 Tax=Vagococcus fessus TaxID=120370 RepID=A0A430A581_9ENTE|nr:hypothetical protein [Vagococcus fessus]RSU01949.1 hypothetical protein CBF31_09280 [Vagococcus fessus]